MSSPSFTHDLISRYRRSLRTIGFPYLGALIAVVGLSLVFSHKPIKPIVQENIPNQTGPAPSNRTQDAIPMANLSNTMSTDSISNTWNNVRESNNVLELVNFASKFPNTPFSANAWQRANELAEHGGLKPELLDYDIGFIGSIISNKDKALPTLVQIIQDRNFERKYPLGFAIYYSDGHKVVNYGRQTQVGNITFDPSSLTVTYKDNLVCLSVMPVRVDGKLMSNITDTCIGGPGPVLHPLRIGNVVLDIEPLGASSQGRAWVIGMRMQEPNPAHP